MSKWFRFVAVLTVMCCAMVAFGQTDGSTTDAGTNLLAGLSSSSLIVGLIILAILSALFGFKIPGLSWLGL